MLGHPFFVGVACYSLTLNPRSGLDPHISVAAATYQAERIAQYNDLPKDEVLDMLYKAISTSYLIGEPVVNDVEVILMLTGKR